MTVIVKDLGYDKFVKELSKKIGLKVGIFGDKGQQTYDNGVTTAEVAGYHEFGVGVPRRSWLRDWTEEDQANIRKKLSEVSKRAIGNMRSVDLKKAGNDFGGWAVEAIRKRIKGKIPPPLKVRVGGTPLIDTGQLKDAIDSEVKVG